MKWTVISGRLPLPEGSTATAKDLEGCNIPALEAGGHLSPVKTTTEPPPVDPEEEN